VPKDADACIQHALSQPDLTAEIPIELLVLVAENLIQSFIDLDSTRPTLRDYLPYLPVSQQFRSAYLRAVVKKTTFALRGSPVGRFRYILSIVPDLQKRFEESGAMIRCIEAVTRLPGQAKLQLDLAVRTLFDEGNIRSSARRLVS
jgi:hypothetical protein